jgi:transposase
MLLKSILNRVQLHHGFVYGAARWNDQGKRLVLDVEIRARKGSRPICSRCGEPGPGYDSLPQRRFEFVPLWGIVVFFLYALRRVNCPSCGVKVERIPWAEGKNHLTTTYAWFLARWARRMSWKEVALVFQTSWDNVFRSVKMAVAWGLAHRNLDNVTAIGIDEIAWKKGHKYLTLVYQIDAGCKRLLWVGRERTQKTLRQFFTEFGKERTAKLLFICSDMWQPYLKIVAEVAGKAMHIIDRFHVMAHFGKAIDKVRAAEARELKAKGQEPVLTGSRWCLLKRPENLTDKQSTKLKELLAINLKTVRAYLLKEEFQFFWRYATAGWAARFLDEWCRRTMRSRLEPMKKIAKMLRTHRELLLNWFRTKGRVALGAVEGFNNKAKVTSRKAYGFRSFDVLKIALYHTLGSLPEPESTHRFC